MYSVNGVMTSQRQNQKGMVGCDSSVAKLSLLGPAFYIHISKTNTVTYSSETDEIGIYSKSEISIRMLF